MGKSGTQPMKSPEQAGGDARRGPGRGGLGRGFLSWHQVLLCLLLLCLGMAASPAFAQLGLKPAEAPEEKVADLYGRETPSGTIAGFVAAIGDQDYERARHYLDLRNTPSRQRQARGVLRAQQLQTVLDQRGQLLPRAAQSDQETGRLDDGLPPDRERVGSIRVEDGREDVLLARVEGEDGTYWLVARETLALLPRLSRATSPSLVDQWMPTFLAETVFLGAPLGHWLALLALAFVAFAIAWLVISLIVRLDGWWCRWRKREERSFLHGIAPPLRLLVAAWIVVLVAPHIGVAIVARELFGRLVEIVGWGALAWLVWRTIDVAGDVVMERLQGPGRGQLRSIAAFVRRLIKAVVLVIGGIAVLDTLGFDVTAGIAALGIGGLALALGAQKLVENLVGSVSILSDQPVRLGEYCKVGDVAGTVEELGIRSTRLRTLNDTIVVIPNSDFAATRIENFSRRGRFWLHQTINLHVQTPPARLRAFLQQLRGMLVEHPQILPGPRVRLLGLGTSDRLPVEIFAYVGTTENEVFLEVQEDVTLRVLDMLEELEIGIMMPPTLVQVAAPASAARAEGEEEVSPTPSDPDRRD